MLRALLLFSLGGTACFGSNTWYSPQATKDLREKTKALALLLMHTYGPHSPFDALTHTITLCLDIDQATPTPRKQQALVTTLRSTILPALDETTTALLKAFINNQDKAPLLKTLNATCCTIEALLKTEKNQKHYKMLKKINTHTRFFMVDPGILSVVGKGIAGCVIAFFGYLTIKKIIDYIASPNNEALQEVALAQGELYATVSNTYHQHVMQGKKSAILRTPPKSAWASIGRRIKRVWQGKQKHNEAAIQKDIDVLSGLNSEEKARALATAMMKLEAAAKALRP